MQSKSTSSVSKFFALQPVQLASLCFQAHLCVNEILRRKSWQWYAPTVHEAAVTQRQRCDSSGQTGGLVWFGQRVASLVGVSEKLDGALCMRSCVVDESLMWILSRVPVHFHKSDRNHGLLVLLLTTAWMVSFCTFEVVPGFGDRAATPPPFYNRY